MPVISALNEPQRSELIASIARAPDGTFDGVPIAILTAAAARLADDSALGADASASSAAKGAADSASGAAVQEARPTGAAFVESTYAASPLVVFSKTTCPFCKKVKALLATYTADANVIELNQRDDMAACQDALLARFGKRSVPQVFVGGKHVGGCDDTVAAHDNGLLKVMLDAAGVRGAQQQQQQGAPAQDVDKTCRIQ